MVKVFQCFSYYLMIFLECSQFFLNTLNLILELISSGLPINLVFLLYISEVFKSFDIAKVSADLIDCSIASEYAQNIGILVAFSPDPYLCLSIEYHNLTILLEFILDQPLHSFIIYSKTSKKRYDQCQSCWVCRFSCPQGFDNIVCFSVDLFAPWIYQTHRITFFEKIFFHARFEILNALFDMLYLFDGVLNSIQLSCYFVVVADADIQPNLFLRVKKVFPNLLLNKS